AGGWFVRQAEGRPPHQLRETHADVEPAVDHARQSGHRNDELWRQHRQAGRAARAAVPVTRQPREGVMVMGRTWLAGSLIALMSMAGSVAVAHAATPLLDAVKKGDKAAIRAELQKRADVNTAEPDGTTP